LSEIKFLKLDYDEVMKKLKAYAEKVIEKGAIAVILIGSLARGNYTAYSDADVIIVLRGDNRRPIDRIPEYIDPALPIDIEPRVYTIDELNEMAKRGARIIKEILEIGKILAGDKQIIEELQRYLTSASR